MPDINDVYNAVLQIRDDVAFLAASNPIAPTQVQTVGGLSDIDNNLGLQLAGEFRAGNGVDPGSGFTGVRMTIDGVKGYNNDVLMASLDASDGKLYGNYGEIGGWLIDDDEIKDTAGLVGLSSAVTAGDDIRFWAGDDTPSDAPLKLYESGDAYFENIYVGSRGGGTTKALVFGDPTDPENATILSYISPSYNYLAVEANDLLSIPGSFSNSVVSLGASMVRGANLITNRMNTEAFGGTSSPAGRTMFNVSHEDIDFYVNGETLGTEPLIFGDASSYRVGINTDTPLATLHVNGHTIAGKSLLGNYEGADNDSQIKGNTDDNLFYVDAGNDRVGIGTNAPATKLDVVGTAQVSDTLTLKKGLVVNEDSNDADTRIEGNGDANLVFVDAGNDRVGIGVNDPDSKLEVNGTLHASGATTLDSTISVGGGATLSTITSGVWTPGLTNTTNISSSTAHEGQYIQIGNMVHCSVAIDITPTASGAVDLRLDPPIVPASNFSDGYKVSGVGACLAVNLSGGVVAITSSKKLKLGFISPDTTARTWRITFMYQIE